MEVIRLEWSRIRKTIFGWATGYSLVAIMFIAFFPSMQTDAMQQLAFAKMESISTVVLSIFGLDSIPDFTKIFNYFGYVAQYLNMASSILAAALGLNMLIREETEGTIEYLYAKPVTRKEIFLQKTAANILGYLLFILIGLATIVCGFVLFADLSLAKAFDMALYFMQGACFIGLVFMAVGVFLSTVISSSRIASPVAFALIFGTFSLGIMGVLIKKLSFLKYFSPLEWVKVNFRGIRMTEPIFIGIGAAVILLSVITGILIYQKKDFQS